VSAPLPTVRLTPSLEGALAGRHPWIYRDHLPDAGRALPHGGWVRVEAGRAAAIGLYDEEGQVALRLYRHAPAGGALTPPDRAFLRRAVAAAVDLRAPLEARGDDAYRLLFGEGDALPGIVVDRYGRYAVVRTYAPSLVPDAGTAASRTLETVVEAVAQSAGLRGVLFSGGPTGGRAAADPSAGDRAGDAGGHAASDGAPVLLRGEAPPPELTVRDGGRSMLVEFGAGQKTGLFLDQRENRSVVAGVARGRRVVDLFAYSGAFTVAALAGGAAHVTSVDVSSGALAAARRNVALLGEEASGRHEVHRADLMRELDAGLDATMGPRGTPSAVDLVVLDPPSLARNKGQRHAALRAFRRLNAGVMERLPEGGLLATASCTAQVSPDDFRGALAAAATDAGVRAQILHEAGHALDHPVPLSFPEGRYLTFVLLRLSRPD
jgi:23S rRNA (cytosine1962-C5)-methyltransferase